MREMAEIQRKIIKLMDYYHQGKLGGEFMPEDKNPSYPIESKENYLYFTLPMALNYQRSAYQLWEAAFNTAIDIETRDVYVPKEVLLMSDEDLRGKLVKHKVALQMNKQPIIWRTLCETFENRFNGDVRSFFEVNDYSVLQIKNEMLKHKKDYPYLSGPKIMNYWLYVMTQYTDLVLKDRENISVAPDTNVVQASLKLGLINEVEFKSSHVQSITASRWEKILLDTPYLPIDVHTPLWLWTRSKFKYWDEL